MDHASNGGGFGRARRGNWRLSFRGLLLLAVVAGLAAGWFLWPAPTTHTVQDQSVTIDLQTADVVDDADLEWERRGVEESVPPSSGGTEGLRANFTLCHTGGGTDCVVDGDTFYMSGEKVRIAGIDAPDHGTAPSPRRRRMP